MKSIFCWMMCYLLIACSPIQTPAAIYAGDFVPCWATGERNQTVPYTVKKGDTLWGIAQEHEVNVNALLISNNLDQNTILRIGQTIKIPSVGTAIHVVSKDETLWGIAHMYQLGVNDILSLNDGCDASRLAIGTTLKIPDRARAIRQTTVSSTTPSRQLSYFSQTFSWPVFGSISSAFGSRSSGYHHGIDITGNIGTSIKAAAAGKVTKVQYHEIYGNMVMVDHGNGKETLYAHMKKSCVKVGQQVKKGQILGEIGVTGRTTGPHLHFEVRQNGIAQNPLEYLPR